MFRYVSLGYTRDLQAEQGVDLAFVAVPMLSHTGKSQRAVVREVENWKSFVDVEDYDYVEEVLEDLRSLPLAELSEAMELFGNMSSGCLRTNATGFCREDELDKLGAMLASAGGGIRIRDRA